MNQINKLELGDEVEDTITGFKGTAIARTQWITGCDRIVVQPKVGKDGKLPENSTFDEPNLKITKKKKPAPIPASPKTGGPRQREQKY